MIAVEARKWWQTIQISWATIMAYRVNFVFMVVGPALVFFFVKYSLWSSIYITEPDMRIMGYNFQEMIQYQIWTLIIGLIGQGSNSMKIAEDIRLGRISSYLIYPFGFWQFHASYFLAFQCVQLTIGLVTIVLLSALGVMGTFDLFWVIQGIFFSLAVSLVWFSMQYVIGVLAFWLEETWVLRTILVTVSQFLSGAIIPIDLYPKWVQELLAYTPFPFL
ncbi:MAG: ABC-2 family transporter protein, partial [Pseudobdellovibrionaceae bacterium]